jgi:hypothetical protein
MTTTPAAAWHPEEDQLQRYVDGGLPGLSAASVEAHLLSCSPCRELVSGGVDRARLDHVHAVIDDRLDQLERPWLERLLLRLRVDELDARALLAAPSLRRAWLLAVLGATVLGVLVAEADHDPDQVFLLLAPVLPVVVTALAYAPALDAAFTLVVATPYSLARLLLARSLAVGVPALVAVAAASLALPGGDTTALVWLLPALALTAAVLVAAPRVGTGVATAAAVAGWVFLVAGLRERGVDVGWVATSGTQAVAGLVALVAALQLVRQWRGIDLEGLA